MKIAILYGGKSPEHYVSIKSAREVYLNFDREKHDVSLIGISKNGEFYLQEHVEDEINTSLSQLDFKINGGFFLNNNQLQFDLLFLAIHGENCEDGRLQSLFELANIKYTGSNSCSSVLCINKRVSKQLVQIAGINVVPYLYIFKQEWQKLRLNFVLTVKEKFKFPIFVKASSLGSSVGVYKVEDEFQLQEKVDEIFKIQDEVLVEEAIFGRELECGVLEIKSEVLAFLPGEIQLFNKNEFYDYKNKYENSSTRVVVPADIKPALQQEIMQASRDIFRILKCRSYARIDFFHADGRLYFNEINTLPGFTTISMFPKMAENSGISYTKLLDIIAENAF